MPSISSFTRLPYIMATYFYREGVECDRAAQLIRRKLPEFVAGIIKEIKEEMGKEYKKEKEW